MCYLDLLLVCLSQMQLSVLLFYYLKKKFNRVPGRLLHRVKQKYGNRAHPIYDGLKGGNGRKGGNTVSI